MISIEKTSISYENSGEKNSGKYSDLMAIIIIIIYFTIFNRF